MSCYPNRISRPRTGCRPQLRTEPNWNLLSSSTANSGMPCTGYSCPQQRQPRNLDCDPQNRPKPVNCERRPLMSRPPQELRRRPGTCGNYSNISNRFPQCPPPVPYQCSPGGSAAPNAYPGCALFPPYRDPCDERYGGRPSPNLTCKSGEPVTVKITADQLAAAGSRPCAPDRKHEGEDKDNGMKYIPLRWEDILGKNGVNGMRVAMMSSGDCGGQQLKVSFGGPGVSSAGETPLKVVAFEPVNSGRIPNQQCAQRSAMTDMRGQQKPMTFNPKGDCNCSGCKY